MTSVTKPENQKPHDYQMDNIRFLLIAAVVFGHMLEFYTDETANSIYRVIYSFHIPAFLFISGYFAKFDPKKIFRGKLVPYLIFQTLYLILNYHLFHNEESLKLQYTTPYWILWYILALFFYSLLVPMLRTENRRNAVLILLFCVVLGLAAGFDDTIGYYLALSRVLVFLPFFATGHYTAAFGLKKRLSEHRLIAAAIAGIAVLICEYLIVRFDVKNYVFYGTWCYDTEGNMIQIRALLYVCAFAWVIFLLAVIPNVKIPILTDIGQRTLPVFLLHGFCVRYIGAHELIQGTLAENILLTVVITVGMIVVFSCKPIYWIFKKLF